MSVSEMSVSATVSEVIREIRQAKEPHYLRDIPKVELHCHLEGCIKFETLLEEYSRHGLKLPYDQNDKGSLMDHFLMTKPVDSLNTFLDIFDRTQSILRDTRTIERIAYETVIDKANENVKLLELRYAPSYINKGHELMSFEDIHTAILQGIERAKASLGTCAIKVGLIVIGIPSLGIAEMEKTVNFAIAQRESIIGFDIAGSELNPLQNKDLIDKVVDHNIKLTIHAGEDREYGKAENVCIAVETLRAHRVGHGVHSVNDSNVMSCVLTYTHVHFEMCPFSNWITSSIPDLHTHPIREFLNLGVSVGVNSDDPGLMGFSLTKEYALLEALFQFGMCDFEKLNRNAYEASFIPDKHEMAHFFPNTSD